MNDVKYNEIKRVLADFAVQESLIMGTQGDFSDAGYDCECPEPENEAFMLEEQADDELIQIKKKL